MAHVVGTVGAIFTPACKETKSEVLTVHVSKTRHTKQKVPLQQQKQQVYLCCSQTFEEVLTVSLQNWPSSH